MSEDVASDSPASRTRHRNPELVRQSFEPISERMRRNKPGSTEDLQREPVRSSPRSPGRPRKNQSTRTSASPNVNKRSPKQQSKKLYPELPKQKRLYPNVHGNDDDDEYDESGTDGNDEVDSVSDSDDSFGQTSRGTPVVKRSAGRKNVEVSEESRHNRGREYDRHRRDPRIANVNKAHPKTQLDVISILIIVAAVIAIVISLLMHTYQRPSDEPIEETVDYFRLYRPHLEQIKTKYPSQTPRFWKIVNSSIKRLLTEKLDTYPAVLLFGIPEHASVTGTCISKDIIKSLNDVFNSTADGYIYSGSLNSGSPAKMKQDLDEKLINNLKNGKGVVLDHVEKLPAQVALLLHGYCDGDNAPYKGVAVILGLHVDSTKQVPDRDDVIEDILNDLWEKELGIDEMPALRSRIANSITVVKNEPNVKC